MEKIIFLNSLQDEQVLFGRYDQNLKLIEAEMGVKLIRTESGLKVIGEDGPVEKVGEMMEYLLSIVADGRDIKKRDVIYAIQLIRSDAEIDFKRLAKKRIQLPIRGGVITPKTKGQIEYVEAIRQYDIVFGIGDVTPGHFRAGGNFQGHDLADGSTAPLENRFSCVRHIRHGKRNMSQARTIHSGRAALWPRVVTENLQRGASRSVTGQA